jgi:hypothetical protein
LKKKILFSRNCRPISIKLGTYHPWVNGIQNCSNEGPGPFQWGDNHKNFKMGWDHLECSSQEPLSYRRAHIYMKVFGII